MFFQKAQPENCLDNLWGEEQKRIMKRQKKGEIKHWDRIKLALFKRPSTNLINLMRRGDWEATALRLKYVTPPCSMLLRRWRKRSFMEKLLDRIKRR